MTRAAITIAMLLHGAQAADAAEWKRMEARCAWVKERTAAWREAMLRCDEAWERLVRALPDDFPEDEEIDPPPEQAEVDAIYAELRAVIDKDRWPRGLYWSL